MSGNGQEWFVTERARAMALVHLTRRDDLEPRPGASEVGLDYLVAIRKADSRPSVRQFGVILRADVEPANLEHVDRHLRPTIRTLSSQLQYPYPVCLFYFTMQDNQGYYIWVAEPVVTESGTPRLQVPSPVKFKRLDREALDAIVTQVDRWYDAFYQSVLVSTS
jgi:hypothetical protein